MSERTSIPQCLTVAGSDSGGGAGIQADLKAFSANGVFGLTVLTSVTAQNTQAVLEAFDLPIAIVRRQLEAVWEDFEIAAIKTGMLSSAAIVDAVSAFLEARGVGRDPAAPPLVVDPVMISKSGYPLLAGDAVEAVRSRLLPLATLATPNRHEAELLAGTEIRAAADLPRIAARILALGPDTVLLKGGHLDEAEAADYLFGGGEGEEEATLLGRFASPRFATTSTHGTGCTYSAAICARLGSGRDLRTAVAEAKAYVSEAIRRGLALGHGHGPTDHFYFLRDGSPSREAGERGPES